MFGQSLLSAFGIACTTDTDQLFTTDQSITSIATYQLNNATTSIPSNTYPGTASNITYAAGKFGNAAVFNGSSSVITLPLSNWLASTSAKSCSVWFKTSVTSGGNRAIVSDYGDGSAFNFDCFLKPSSGKIEISSRRGTNYYADSSSGNFNDGNWHLAVIVDDIPNSSLKLYVDNNLEVSISTGSASINSSVLYIGTYSSGYYFDGSIDQVRIFDKALSSTERTTLYNETTSTATSASVDYVGANPNSIAYYKMSDATDQLGNHNGTATNVNFNTEGKFGFAGAFNGSSSYINTNIPASIFNTNTWSISIWFKQTNNTYGYFLGNTNSGLNNGIAMGFYTAGSPNGGARFDFITRNNGSTIGRWQGGTHTVNVWTNIVIVNNNNSFSFYQDGSLASSTSGYSQPLAGGTYSSGTDFALGRGGDYNAEYFGGELDQIRIYDSAISAANVSTLYKEVECEPVAINALDHFNTVLYTGNGASSRSITGVGFAPDFTWTKKRGPSTADHLLQNTVNGAGTGSALYSASNGAAGSTDQYGYISAFGTDGVTYQAGSSGSYPSDLNNENNSTYVAWNWKAALANLSSSFNGSSSYIDLAFASLNVNNNFTWSFWIKFNSFTLYDTPIGFFMNGYTNFIDLVDVNGQLSFYDGQSRLNTPGSTFATGSWYHVAVTKSSTNGRKFYVNGSEVASNSSNSNSGSSSGGRNLLGAYSSSGNPTTALLNVDGDMAQVRIFHSALTASQISDLYTEPAASNNTLNYPAGAGCIAAYPLQTDAVDLSGNYSGTSSNITFGQPGYLTGNTDGTIPSTVAANVEAGFSVVQWTSPSGNGNPSNVGHGLSKAPELIFYKGINYADNWYVYSQPTGLNKYLNLNTDGAVTTNNSNGFTNVNSLTFTTNLVNGSYNILSYCFTSIPGYSKIGSYVGTSSAGNFQYTGFEPSWLMVKCSSVGGRPWVMFDNKRMSGSSYYELYADLANAESPAYPDVVFNSNGWTAGTNASGSNRSGDTYIFLAIA